MIESIRRRITETPIRLRLTLWYVLLMGVSFVLLSSYLLFRIQRSLMNSIDIALQIAVSQTIPSIEDIREGLVFDDEVQLSSIGGSQTANFSLQLISPSGTVLDTIGAGGAVPAWVPEEPGYSTRVKPGDDDQWRFYSQPIVRADGEVVGWVQAAQSLENVTDTLQDFREQLLWGIPLVLSLAGIGGYFLADRALRPIDRITRTAQMIEVGDLSRRIAYRGPDDEIGRLARTFDQMLERLQAAFESERRFSADAAHELRTPLTVLKGQIEVALNKPRRRPEYEEVLQGLASQVDRLIRLSNALLFLSHSDQDQLSQDCAILNLGNFLWPIIEEIQPLASEKGLALTANIPADLTLYGNADHLIRLFLNLLDNAVKYTPLGGQILVQAAAVDDDTQVIIHNSGPGISRKHLPHLFDRFYRVDADRSSMTGGSGLGLAIAREIVRLHGGTIGVESESGDGITFTVRLPRTKTLNHSLPFS